MKFYICDPFLVMRNGAPGGSGRNYIIHCCGSVKCQKSYDKYGGVKGIEWQRNRRLVEQISVTV